MHELQHDEQRFGAEAQAIEWDARYSKRDGAMWSGRPNGRLVAEVAELTPGRALDVGSGEGADAIWLARRGWTVTAIDISAPMLGRARENAAELYASVHEKLLTLPGDLEIYPGHFSGSVCGAGLSGKPTSTIAFERRWNRMLSLDRQAFIDAIVDVPPKPDEMERVLAFNRGERTIWASR